MNPKHDVTKIVLDTLKQIKDAPTEGTMFVQEKALKFCKQQELQKLKSARSTAKIVGL